jgi:hypothetical protein
LSVTETSADIEVLVLSLGTTTGLRVADAQLAEMLGEAGVRVAVSAVEMGLTGHLRTGYPLTEVIEACSARRALRTALERHNPRALILATSTNSLLTDTRDLPYAVWFDSPGRLNRSGIRNLPVRALERRSFDRARLLLPWSEQALSTLMNERAPSYVLSPPIAESGIQTDRAREPLVLAYTPEPWGKGLELICRAWSLIGGRDDTRLLITGIEPDRAHHFLRRCGLALPAAAELTGRLAQPAFHELLDRARVFLSGARWEDFGLAPLEALDRGAVFVAAPGGGPCPALELTRALDGRFVASDASPEALAAALSAALTCTDRELLQYREAALAALAPYRYQSNMTRLRDEVLPILLG